MDILNVTEEVIIDDSITNAEYHTHQPYASTTFNNNDEIRIPIQQQDMYTLPSRSYIYIEGKLTTSGGAPNQSATFVNNAISFLFSELRYELNGVVIDSVRNVGVTTTLKAYPSYSTNENRKLINAGWDPIKGAPTVDSNGNFNVCIPLKVWLGFAEDYSKILLNVKQELILIRSNSDVDAVKVTAATTTPTTPIKIDIQITKINWKVPHIKVSLEEQLRLTKLIDQNLEIPIAFRSWELHEYPTLTTTNRHSWTVKTATQLEVPRIVIFALSTNRKNNNENDMSKFDACDLRNFVTYLNSERYPYDNLNIDYKNNHFSTLYEMFAGFQKSYYGRESEPMFSPSEFKTTAPVVVTDCSYQQETLHKGPVEVRVEFETGDNIPDKTSAYCLILHDRLFRYNPLTSSIRQS